IHTLQLPNPVSPTIFLTWAKRYDIFCPPELVEQVVKYHGPDSKDRIIAQKDQEILQLKDELKSKPAHQKETDSLFKMLLGMICLAYSGETLLNDEIKAPEVARRFKRIGISMDDGTVRKYLKSAKQYLLENY
ncbi:MAG: hypothetical protein V4543_07615, partial [Bacteroidota bacterium]